MSRALSLLALTCLLASPLLAQDATVSYQSPAPELARLVDAPRTPSVTLSPDRSVMAFLERPGLPGIEEMAQPEIGLAGIRINPRLNGPGPTRSSSFSDLAFRAVDGEGDPRSISGLPDAPRIRNVAWSPDGAYAAFTLDRASQVELWVADVAAGTARRWIEAPINDAAPRAPFVWLPGSDGVVVRTIPSRRGAAPEVALVPTGPVVRESAGEAAPARTYQDLLESAHDEALLEHYVTSQLVVARLDGTVQSFGSPSLNVALAPSPDGQYLLTETITPPYSYLVPWSRFPHTIAVHDLASGDVVHTVATLPLAERIPIAFGSVRTGPRSVQWRADAPSTLVWTEAQDGGDAGAGADVRDRLFVHAAPFDDAPTPWTELALRFSSLTWGDDDTAILYEYWWADRALRVHRLTPGSLDAAPELLFEYSFEDRYNDPGRPMTVRNDAGYNELLLDNGAMFLTGQGASPEGNRPFVRRFDLTAKETMELFRSEAPFYERPVAFLDDASTELLTRRETTTEPPNYVLRDLDAGTDRAVTAFPHPYPELAAVQKETVEYERADGVPLSATLYLPPGYDAERDGPLPTLVWAYPREYKSASAAGQRSDSPYQFTRVSYWGAVPYVTRGYAVLDNAAFPIVGEGEAEPNDSFREQLVMNGAAVIEEGVRRGVVDSERVAVGGHSYGAFMTANLLAHSDLFRAGIARSGAYNRTLTPFGFQREERTYWQAPDLYAYMSPFMHAEKINEPILLIHGQADNNPGTFTLQSERLYGALNGLGGTARLVLLPAESHGYRSRESILHMLWEQDQWLDTYVKQAEVTMGSSAEAEEEGTEAP
ncbi:MAG: prolyl oligopeptidase family serine peptidase [Bacteroidota bacterium]